MRYTISREALKEAARCCAGEISMRDISQEALSYLAFPKIEGDVIEVTRTTGLWPFKKTTKSEVIVRKG